MGNASSMYLYVKLNWDANRFLPAESKDCTNSASYEYRNMSARGAVYAHGSSNYLLENLSCQDNENVVNYKLERLDDIFFSVLVLWIRVFLRKIGSLAT